MDEVKKDESEKSIDENITEKKEEQLETDKDKPIESIEDYAEEKKGEEVINLDDLLPKKTKAVEEAEAMAEALIRSETEEEEKSEDKDHGEEDIEDLADDDIDVEEFDGEDTDEDPVVEEFDELTDEEETSDKKEKKESHKQDTKEKKNKEGATPRFVSPEEEAARKKNIKKIVIAAAVACVLIVGCIVGFLIYKKVSPSSEKVDLTKYFELAEGEKAIIVDAVRSDKKARVIDGETYIPADIAIGAMDDRLYVENDNSITYVSEEGISDLSTSGSASGAAVMTEVDGENYLSLSFVSKNATCEYSEFDDPARIAIFSDRTKSYTVATLSETARIRKGPGDKYPYLVEVESGKTVNVDDSKKVENEYQPVVTDDGIAGYIPTKSIAKTDTVKREFTKEPTSFTQKALDKKVCMGWHNIGAPGNDVLPYTVDYAKDLNVISPTWFGVKGKKGEITSYSVDSYVVDAHSIKLQVWPTLRDFGFDETVDLASVLAKGPRQKLIENVIEAVKSCNADGINVDFEMVTEETAGAFLEFLRELVVKGHEAGLVVSMDAYPIQSYNRFYNYEELGRIMDYVIVMEYNEHYSGSEEAGPVSSLGYVQDSTSGALTMIPKERLVVGLPFFCRLWTQTEGNEKKLESEVLGTEDAESWIESREVQKQWDDGTGMYYAEHKEGKTTRMLWLEDEKSIEAKLGAVKEEDVAGVAFWSLGRERARMWNTIAKTLN